MPDPIFEHPRLAEVYDIFDDDRGDLDVYRGIVDELGARSVLDLGCGTGTFATILAAGGLTVIGVDPAEASLEIARGKSDAVTWVLGDASTVSDAVDLVTMTGNVAQVFVTDDAWATMLDAVRAVTTNLVFEVRDPTRRAWTEWTHEHTHRTEGHIETWTDLLDVRDDLVTFRQTYVFHDDGTVLTSDSTLRFRTREQVEASLRDAGFTVEDVRDAPDRPGKELVFVAR